MLEIKVNMYILKHFLVPRPRLKIFLNFLRRGWGLGYVKLYCARAHGGRCVTRMRKVLKVT